MNQGQFQLFMESTKFTKEQITHILKLLSLNKTDLATNRSLDNQDQFIQQNEGSIKA